MMPPPPPVPVRPAPYAYHFHTYDYPGSAANGPWGLSLAQPNRGGWQFYSLMQDLIGLRALGTHLGVPNIALNYVGNLASSRQILMLSFGNQGAAANRPTVLITGGVHAREWIAAEITYLIAEYLIVNYVAGAPPLNPHAAQLQALVNSRNIRIIPMLNPDGNYRSVFGTGSTDRMWRKNLRDLPSSGQDWARVLAPGQVPNQPFRNVQSSWKVFPWAVYEVPDYAPRNPAFNPANPNTLNYRNRWLSNGKTGVDINRNFNTPFYGYDCGEDYDNYDPGSESYFGYRRVSELETGHIQHAMTGVFAQTPANSRVAIDYHSYGRLVLYPDETFNAGLSAEYTRTGEMLGQLIVDQAGQRYRLGDPYDLIDYDATGTVADYAAERQQARAFTVELDPATEAEGGFQLQEGQIQSVFETNIRAALAAIEAPVGVIQAPLVTLRYLNTWNVYGRANQLP